MAPEDIMFNKFLNRSRSNQQVCGEKFTVSKTSATSVGLNG